MKKGGASREFYISDLATHVIADNKNFSSFEEALETTGLPIVTVSRTSKFVTETVVRHKGKTSVYMYINFCLSSPKMVACGTWC